MVVMVIYSVTLSYVKGERIEPVVQKYSVKKVFLKFTKFTGKHQCQSFFFSQNVRPKAYNFTKKEALTWVFFCEFCEISKNTFFYRIPPVTASERKKF